MHTTEKNLSPWWMKISLSRMDGALFFTFPQSLGSSILHSQSRGPRAIRAELQAVIWEVQKGSVWDNRWESNIPSCSSFYEGISAIYRPHFQGCLQKVTATLMKKMIIWLWRPALYSTSSSEMITRQKKINPTDLKKKVSISLNTVFNPFCVKLFCGWHLTQRGASCLRSWHGSPWCTAKLFVKECMCGLVVCLPSMPEALGWIP